MAKWSSLINSLISSSQPNKWLCFWPTHTLYSYAVISPSALRCLFISVCRVSPVGKREPLRRREEDVLWWCQRPSLLSWWLERLGCRWRCWALWRRRPRATSPDPERVCLSRRPPSGQMVSPSCRCRRGDKRCRLFGGQRHQCQRRTGSENQAGLRGHGKGQRPSGQRSLWRVWLTPWTPTHQYLWRDS